MVQSWLESFSNMFDPQSLGASTFYTPFLRNTHFNAENPSREARISGGAESLELTSRHLYSSNLIVYLYLALLIVPKCFWTEIFYILERPFFASLLAIWVSVAKDCSARMPDLKHCELQLFTLIFTKTEHTQSTEKLHHKRFVFVANAESPHFLDYRVGKGVSGSLF